jgi:serine-type D-Ala-D-Ala carboxypeptidase (penicillin-binding protein 5/6)
MISRCVVVLSLVLLALPAPGLAQELEDAPPEVGCQAFLLYDVATGRVIASRRADDQRQIASLTKLMTALLACERLRFDGRYELSEAERKAFNTETLRAQQLLELMLVASNNRACEVVARLVAGGERDFVALMNQRAQELGLAQTRYVNPSGLPASGQASSAADVLALLLELRELPGARQALTLHSADVGGRKYTSTLLEMYQRHPGLLGGKTGYTRAAGRCLALDYDCDGREYILITLGSPGVAAGFADAERLLKYYGLYGGELHTW